MSDTSESRAPLGVSGIAGSMPAVGDRRGDAGEGLELKEADMELDDDNGDRPGAELIPLLLTEQAVYEQLSVGRTTLRTLPLRPVHITAAFATSRRRSAPTSSTYGRRGTAKRR